MKYRILFELMEQSDQILVFRSTAADRINFPSLKRDRHYCFRTGLPKYKYDTETDQLDNFTDFRSGTLVNFDGLHIAFERKLHNFSHRYTSPPALKSTGSLNEFQKECEMLERDQEMLDMLRSYGKL